VRTITIDRVVTGPIVLLPPPLEPLPAVRTLPRSTPEPPKGDPEWTARPVPDIDAPPEPEPQTPAAGEGERATTPSEPDAAQGAGPAGPPADPAPDAFTVVDVYPQLLTSVEPRYPDLAREAGVEGVVRVLMLVGLDGRVVRAVVAPGGSVLLLDEAALDAARGCVFKPALTNDHPVKVWVSRSYRFSLH